MLKETNTGRNGSLHVHYDINLEKIVPMREEHCHATVNNSNYTAYFQYERETWHAAFNQKKKTSTESKSSNTRLI